MAACRLTSLPEKFSAIVPNLRVLNLNYNFLETGAVVRGLAGLKRLRKMTIVGSRMSGTKALIRMLDAMGENIEMLDFRCVFLRVFLLCFSILFGNSKNSETGK